MGLYATLRKLILSSGDRHKSESLRLEAIILKCQKTGKKSIEGDEVKLLLHISPTNGRSYVQEHTDVFKSSDITHYLQPGRLVSLEMNSIRGKAILHWNE